MTIIIDGQFEDILYEKELKSLAKQVAYCHSKNRKSN